SNAMKKLRDDFSEDSDSDIPEKFTPKTDLFDYTRREEMIPMRDGVKLNTIILIPKGVQNTPIVLTRTPYHAERRTLRFNSSSLSMVVPQMNDTTSAARYIIVYQDVRGKYGSEGGYMMNKPLTGPLNTTGTDHSTDTYDTIDWLVKNIPESNGRVAAIGGSYEGYTTLMCTINPHPALKAVVPFASMVDGWMGDDWFHMGAFRQEASLPYAYNQEATRKNEIKWWSGSYDTYDAYLRAGNAGAMAASRGMESIGFWKKLAAHPSYDSFWQQQAMDKMLAQHPLTVPMLIVGGLFDQEDIYGSPKLYKVLAPKDPEGKLVHFVLGPWNHGQGRRDARSLGPLQFEGDTGGWFRRNVMQPFLDHYLKDAPKLDIPRVLSYETGANAWHRYDDWPPERTEGQEAHYCDLYVQEDGKLGFEMPAAKQAFDEYVSDPAKPVPYRQRPTIPSYAAESTWGEWLVDDQRHTASRTDVLVWATEPLKEPLRVAGQPVARLFASTSGSDADWVVKIIDVWPDEVPENPKLGGYQQMLSADIFRGRYREDFAVAKPLVPDKVLEYRIPLPQVSHTFLPGHRIMVQVQSSWFPLYDRNPQTFVPNIMFAPPESYRKATQRVWRTAEYPTAIEIHIIS
nr:Chain A, Peptidase S15/CocE/NonD [Thaumarchaeota archaeon SCGC AB-539-E09]4PF1_B Chain B, Peptidase S15/CocE/NonD [Thaumarchaeota archaeon SCGC AB-539-E09]4PF1_C Chain C, Peptidase S15/CocE/NonD [Thaumarchaeota archaeon SCGC AB-539-E09]4PF1_D Chain D, Peptidase S15/CocE/NonD [Thaumarchaeota archaeon SCGC AB-539-E09]